jgi:hypothetical protein
MIHDDLPLFEGCNQKIHLEQRIVTTITLFELVVHFSNARLSSCFQFKMIPIEKVKLKGIWRIVFREWLCLRRPVNVSIKLGEKESSFICAVFVIERAGDVFENNRLFELNFRKNT